MIRAGSPADLRDAVGSSATGSWIEVTQERIDMFAEATGDRQWIHVDTERAATGPYGTTIAHGLLTLSLVPEMLAEVLEVDGTAAVINYGVESARFLTPVATGSRIRVAATLTDTKASPHGIRAVFHLEVSCEGSDRPALVSDLILLFISAP